MNARFVSLTLALFLIASTVYGQTPDYQVTVQSGDQEVRGVVLTLDLPSELSAEAIYLEDEAGRRLPVQQTAPGSGVVFIDHLAAGETRVYALRTGSESDGQVTLQEQDGTLRFFIAGQPVLQYQAAPKPPPPGVDSIYTRGGYIHPVYTPSGVVVTDDFPANHIHHHGIWSAWTNTVFDGREPDFWNMGAGTGTVVPVSSESLPIGPVFGGFRGTHRFLDLTTGEAVPVLDEDWEVRVYNVAGVFDRPVWLFDLTATHTITADQALVLPEYRYGGVGFRGHGQWNGADNTVFLTSEGKDRSNGHATRARWCHIGGYVDGHLAGVTIMDHPDNFRAPQPMRIHPTEPFFNYAPSQLGDWAIEPGEPYVARYRYIVYDGEPDAALLEQFWNGFAYAPDVSVSR